MGVRFEAAADLRPQPAVPGTDAARPSCGRGGHRKECRPVDFRPYGPLSRNPRAIPLPPGWFGWGPNRPSSLEILTGTVLPRRRRIPPSSRIGTVVRCHLNGNPGPRQPSVSPIPPLLGMVQMSGPSSRVCLAREKHLQHSRFQRNMVSPQPSVHAAGNPAVGEARHA